MRMLLQAVPAAVVLFVSVALTAWSDPVAAQEQLLSAVDSFPETDDADTRRYSNGQTFQSIVHDSTIEISGNKVPVIPGTDNERMIDNSEVPDAVPTRGFPAYCKSAGGKCKLVRH